MNNVKCVIVGDGAVGKTCVLHSYITRTVPTDYVPTVFDNHTVSVMSFNTPYSMSLWDTAGQEDYDRLRPLSYPGTDVFLICFSIDSPESFQHVETKWIPEIKHYSSNVPCLLIGTKSDLRRNQANCIDLATIESLQQRVGTSGYIECSAYTMYNIDSLFQEAIRHVVAARSVKPKSSRKKCTIV
jgi:small GTP-binding protein